MGEKKLGYKDLSLFSDKIHALVKRRKVVKIIMKIAISDEHILSLAVCEGVHILFHLND